MITAKDILACVGAITLLPAAWAAIYCAVTAVLETRRPEPRAQHPGRVKARDCTPVHKRLTDPVSRQKQVN